MPGWQGSPQPQVDGVGPGISRWSGLAGAGCSAAELRAGWCVWGGEAGLVGGVRHLAGRGQGPPSLHLGLTWAFLLPAQESYKYFPSSVSPAPQGGRGMRAGRSGPVLRFCPAALAGDALRVPAKASPAPAHPAAAAAVAEAGAPPRGRGGSGICGSQGATGGHGDTRAALGRGPPTGL